jgi:hypothetical protein
MDTHKAPEPARQEPVKSGKPVVFRERFVMIDSLAIDKKILYRDGDGRYLIGLILETERVGTTPRFRVRQATPSEMRKNGAKGKIVGSWHFLSKRWESEK